MSYETFTWCPRTESEGQGTFKVLTAQFGDGFSQEAGYGLNNESESWPLQFTGRESYVKSIRDFLRSHQGFKRFKWTPPMGEEGLYICREYRLTALGAGSYTLTATFQQRFAP